MLGRQHVDSHDVPQMKQGSPRKKCCFHCVIDHQGIFNEVIAFQLYVRVEKIRVPSVGALEISTPAPALTRLLCIQI